MSSLANVTGCRKFGEETSGPKRILLVTCAAAASSGTAPYHGPSRKDCHDKWS
jgi:hypothetical protein